MPIPPPQRITPQQGTTPEQGITSPQNEYTNLAVALPTTVYQTQQMFNPRQNVGNYTDLKPIAGGGGGGAYSQAPDLNSRGGSNDGQYVAIPPLPQVVGEKLSFDMNTKSEASILATSNTAPASGPRQPRAITTETANRPPSSTQGAAMTAAALAQKQNTVPEQDKKDVPAELKLKK